MFMDITTPVLTTLRMMGIMQERLRDLIREDPRSEAQIARELGLSERRFNHYITGRSRLPSALLSPLCEVLGTHPNYLFGWSNEVRPKCPNTGMHTAALEERIRKLELALQSYRKR